MKMKSKNISSFRKNDLVSLKTVYGEAVRKYIVNSVNAKENSIAVVPVEDANPGIPGYDKPSFILHVPMSSIAKIEKLPKTDLLFLLNEIDNPHIKAAIESLYERKRNR